MIKAFKKKGDKQKLAKKKNTIQNKIKESACLYLVKLKELEKKGQNKKNLLIQKNKKLDNIICLLKKKPKRKLRSHSIFTAYLPYKTYIFLPRNFSKFKKNIKFKKRT